VRRLKTELALRLAEDIWTTDSTRWWFDDDSDWWVNGTRGANPVDGSDEKC